MFLPSGEALAYWIKHSYSYSLSLSISLLLCCVINHCRCSIFSNVVACQEGIAKAGATRYLGTASTHAGYPPWVFGAHANFRSNMSPCNRTEIASVHNKMRARAHAPTHPHTPPPTHIHTRTHARTHTHTHPHTKSAQNTDAYSTMRFQ